MYQDKAAHVKCSTKELQVPENGQHQPQLLQQSMLVNVSVATSTLDRFARFRDRLRVQPGDTGRYSDARGMNGKWRQLRG